MRKWRHTDGCSAATADQFHELLESIERRVGELGTGTWGADVVVGGVSAQGPRGEYRFDVPTQYSQRVACWIIDAVIARKQLRRERNDPTFGATRD